MSQVNDAVISIDNDYRITYWNKGAERLYGLKKEEVINKFLTDAYTFEWVKPEDEKISSHDLMTKGYWRGENIHVKKNGERIRIEAVTTMLKDNVGKSIGILAIIRDITERKKAEDEIETLLSDLKRSMKN